MHTTQDIFQSRLPLKSSGDSDFGLLYSIDEELATYGWLTDTGVIISGCCGFGSGGGLEVMDGELKGMACIRLVWDPFSKLGPGGAGGWMATNKAFMEDVRGVGKGWVLDPGAGGAVV
ncbi:unnamed protein product [Tuber aestivum]|uniref:Uncharacterized protein n=1 Tax=Tuber aestivum TaxID=59557 RepID=A0A292PYW3_9PEZI|nr:unnamed protein product [Tuber aestivum]